MTERKPARRPRCTDSLPWPFVLERDPQTNDVGPLAWLADAFTSPVPWARLPELLNVALGKTSSSQLLGPLLLPKLQSSEHSNRKTIVIVKASKIAASIFSAVLCL